MIPVKEKATARCSVGVYILAHSGDIVYPQNKVKEVLLVRGGHFSSRKPRQF